MAAQTDVRTCSISRTLELVGEKWSLLAIRELMLGNHRFEQIARYTGAPRDILTNRLRKLEEHGLIRRELYQERPARHEYRLTRLGASLQPVITALRAWGDEHLADADGPPVLFRHSCGEILRPAVVCEHCGGEVRGGDLTLVVDR